MNTSIPLKQSVNTVAAALIVGFDLVGFAVALASLMFSGPLSPWLTIGVSATLASSLIVTLILASLSQLKTLIAGVQDVGTAVLAATLVTAVGALAGNAKPATALAIIASATLTTGVLLFLTGWLKLGRFARFFPLEVLAGFLAATGCLLLMGGLAMVARVDLSFAGMLDIATAPKLLATVPALALAAIITLGMRRSGSPLMLLALLFIAGSLFHLWRNAAGYSQADVVAMGFLPDFKSAGESGFSIPALITAIEWPTVLQALPTIATVAALSLFATLMNMSALEVATGKDIEVDHELKRAGIANLLAAGTAGAPGFAHLSLTLLLDKLRVSGRGVGLSVALIQLICLYFATQIVSIVPTFVAAGLILYYGIDLVYDWLVKTRKSFNLREWAVVLFIVVVSIFHGFLLAILSGFLIATMLFAYSYANAPVVRHATTLAQMPSTVDRSPDAMATLRRSAASVRVFQLQGFLFFGTSDKVVSYIRNAAKAEGGLRMAIIDFARVTEMDSASANAFKRIDSFAQATGFEIIFSGMSTPLATTFARVGIVPGAKSRVSFAQDLDRALEQAENSLLGETANNGHALSLPQHFGAPNLSLSKLSQLFAKMSRLHFSAGEKVIKAGSAADELFFIEAGRAIVQRQMNDGTIKRLRTMMPGAIVGDIGFSLGGLRTADVHAETDTTALSITKKEAENLARKHPELALIFNHLLNRALAEKVVTANRMTEHAG